MQHHHLLLLLCAHLAGSTRLPTTPCLPLLPASPSPLWGTQYSAPSDPVAANRTSALWGETLSRGARLFQLSLPWGLVEAIPNQPNIELVAALFNDLRAANAIPLFNLAVIDTNRVSVPPDLADPTDSGRLAAGLTWTSPQVLQRYAAVVQAVAPLAAYAGAPYFGTGNEVDVNLAAHPETAQAFVELTYSIQAYVRRLTAPHPLAVGATLTVAGLGALAAAPPPWLTALLATADVTPLTYYALAGGFAVQPQPAAVSAAVLQAAALLPPGACTVFQEVGMPSGYGNASSVDGGSEALQAAFVQDFMGRVAAQLAEAGHALRAASVFELVDMEGCRGVAPQYNLTSPAFVEYLCTLGLAKGSGQPKAAFSAFLQALPAV